MAAPSKKKQRNSDSDEQETYLEPLATIDATQSDAQVLKTIDTEVAAIIEQTIECKEKGANEKVDHLIIFVHGFNNDKDSIDKRGQIIDNALGSTKVITTAFNWKSFQSLLSYSDDQQHARTCAQYFSYYIQQIRTHKKCPFTQVDFVCHSMGNFLFSETVLYNKDDTKQLNTLFQGSNIIALAADVEPTQYTETVYQLKSIVSTWTHYYNAWDAALVISNPKNKRLSKLKCEWGRAGQYRCTAEWVKSVEWTETIFSHGYIDDLFKEDRKLRRHILRQLGLIVDDEDDVKEKSKVYVDPRKDKTGFNVKKKYDRERAVNELKNGVICGDGKQWWKDEKTLAFEKKAETMQLKLQKHTNVDGKGGSKSKLVGLARSVGWWSNHVDPYRIILQSQYFNGGKKTEWKEIRHSNSWEEIDKSFTLYTEYIENM